MTLCTYTEQWFIDSFMGLRHLEPDITRFTKPMVKVRIGAGCTKTHSWAYIISRTVSFLGKHGITDMESFQIQRDPALPRRVIRLNLSEVADGSGQQADQS